MIWASANRKEKVLWTGTNKYLLLSQPGWDKIFYFVGSNTFSQKFRLKQRESDATKGVQNSGKLGFNLQIYYISINASFDFLFFIEFMRFGKSGTHAFTVVNCRDLCTLVPLSADIFKAGSNPVCSSLELKYFFVLSSMH